ncbi:hypothetical protein AXG93_625s1240 [Marchantia polymorpha subsp. ruderalis]|uniref:Uncharacterized protein n=2 Tax=Marchantia polymorpha TaxID=3197 RepID=A0A176VCE5_MARPO|nr:hypothetical protein AXG93_625s1240 [Marchantia polymorpha subsp. ruderalis]
MHGKSMKLFLSVFATWGTLQFVDLRDNLDGAEVGVLENGEHLSSFSAAHEPFWRSQSQVAAAVHVSSSPTSRMKRKPKKSRRTRNRASWDLRAIGDPQVDEAQMVKTEPSEPEVKDDPRPSRQRSLLLSPLLDNDTESADLIPMDTLPTSWTEESQIPRVCDSRASPCLSPLDNLSTPFSYSEYLYLCEAPDIEPFPVSSVSRDDTQMTESSFSENIPSSIGYDQRADRDPQLPRPYTPIRSLNLSYISRNSSRTYEQSNTENRTSLSSQPLRAPSPESPIDDSEWEAFTRDMAQKLLHVQDGLDAVISSAKPDFLLAAQTAMTSLQDGLRQLLPS